MLGSLSLSFFEGDKTTIAILDGSKFGIRFLESESHDWQVNVTSHPVEKGSDITDHIQPQPRSVTISSRESDASLNLLQTLSNSGSNRVENAKAFLLELYSSKKPVTVTTRLHTYEQMVAISITQSSAVGDGQSMPWSVTLREVEIAESTSVSLASLPKVKGVGAKTVKAGKKPPVPAKPAEAAKVTQTASKVKGSWAWEKATGFFGG